VLAGETRRGEGPGYHDHGPKDDHNNFFPSSSVLLKNDVVGPLGMLLVGPIVLGRDCGTRNLSVGDGIAEGDEKSAQIF
jgi:hypothetical protein